MYMEIHVKISIILFVFK